MMTSLSLTARVSLLVAGAAASVLLIAGVLFERAAENHFLDDDTQELRGKMELIRGLLAGVRTPEALANLPTRIDDAMAGHPGIAITVATGRGEVLVSAGPAAMVRHLLQGEELGRPQPGIWSDGEHSYRVLASRLPLGIAGRPPENVAIAIDISDDRAFMTALRESLWFGLALAGASMAFLGWVSAYRGLLPLRRISAAVAAMSAEQLDRKLSETGVPPELRDLVLAFNRMLARLDDSFRRLSEFSADLAHELRTPIHNMLIQTQVALGQERDGPEYRSILQSNVEELERLSRTASDMLFLARADNRLIAPKREAVDLRKEIEQLLGFYEAYAGERGVKLVHSGAAAVSGDRLMLQRAFANLLSNAIRFTPAGETVAVDIAEAADAAEVAVTNPGPAIAADQLSRIFERLYRIDPARREGESDHAGLGLSIAKSIVELHGGTIRAESQDGKTRFIVGLPHSLPAQPQQLRDATIAVLN
jgi:two-component system heavy metal sensor histidine kinase CusS